MKVLMTGGGTAGHVNPALAIAKSIREHHPDAVIEFVSSNLPNDKAIDLVSREGYKLNKVDICGSYKTCRELRARRNNRHRWLCMLSRFERGS